MDARAEAAAGPMQQTAARIMAVIRAGEGIWMLPLALMTAAPPVSVTWLVPALVLYAVWCGVYAWTAFTRGLVTWLVISDVAVTVLACLANGRLVPLVRISDGSGWVATLASLCVVGLPLAWRARCSVPAGLLIATAFVVGCRLAGYPETGLSYAPILAGQVIAAAVVMALVRRAGRTADNALADANAARRRAKIDQVRRGDQTRQFRLLHDTALTTLTLVGSGAITGRSDRLARRAAADLSEVERIATAVAEAPRGLVRLDRVLTDVVHRDDGRLTVDLVSDPCRVPVTVAEAIAGAVAEALRNVRRHAGTGSVRICARTTAEGTIVEVSDAGRGFDPQRAPTHRFGVRESIVGRMVAVGGTATVDSAPGVGTRWVLEWHSDRH